MLKKLEEATIYGDVGGGEQGVRASKLTATMSKGIEQRGDDPAGVFIA
jgi:hypothetical protein